MKYITATVYVLIMSIIGFCVILIDKRRAVNGQWRIAEKTLFAIAAVGGGLGCILGMFTLRHKTKRAKFLIGMPIVTLSSLIIVYAVTYFV